MSQYHKKTKIIVTIGPATNTETRIRSLLKRGVDVFRINFSHGDHATHKKTIELIRKLSVEMESYCAVLADLCGPKIRVGTFEHGEIRLEQGSEVIVTTRRITGSNGLIPCQYPHLHEDMKIGQKILLDDGKLELRVEKINDTDLFCKVRYGGVLSDHKGMNLPETEVSAPALTDKDKKDMALAIECEVDFFALSFVRSARDVLDLQQEMSWYGVSIPVISKIERPEAIENIDEILQHSYGIMIARGDLGIEISAEKVPLLQNQLIDRARAAHKPVIVATQMMESMIVNARPTRAEVGDVANAAIHGADAVMLSGETSVGKFPLQSVEYMHRIVSEIEHDKKTRAQLNAVLDAHLQTQQLDLREAMSHAALTLTIDLNLRALVVPTHSGTTARILSSYRPSTMILGVSHNTQICRRMAIHWGVQAIHMNPLDFRDWRGLTNKILNECHILEKSDKVLVVAGFSEVEEQSEPVLKLLMLNQ